MSFLVIISMLVSLCVLGIFWIFIKDLNFLAQRVSAQLQVVVFLTPEADLESAATKIQKIEGIESILKISKQEAKIDMLTETPGLEELLKDDNPFPDSIEINVTNPGYMEQVVNQLKDLAPIEEIQYNHELADRISEIERVLALAGLIITFILCFATFAIIFNTINLSISSRKNELEIMQLIGASGWFIKMPFIIEGFLFGLISSIFASVFLVFWRYFTVSQIKKWLQFLPFQADLQFVFQVIFWIIPFGVILGVLGSAMSMHRHFKFEKALD